MSIKKYSKRQRNLGMVDVLAKDVTKRTAIASSEIKMSAKAFKAFLQGSPKGDVLETARVAAIMAAKAVPAIIPLCHPLQLGKINVSFKVDKKKYLVTTIVEVSYEGKTGVEMEALTAATVSSLTIYDMMKWADKGSLIQQTKLLYKAGGQSGEFRANL